MPPLHPLKNLKGFLRPSFLYPPGAAGIVSVLVEIVHLGGGVYERHAFAAAAGRRDICAGIPVYGGTAAAAAIRRTRYEYDRAAGGGCSAAVAAVGGGGTAETIGGW